MTRVSPTTVMKFAVANPARKDVQMDVFGDPRAGGLPQIHADVQTGRRVSGLQYSLGRARQIASSLQRKTGSFAPGAKRAHRARSSDVR